MDGYTKFLLTVIALSLAVLTTVTAWRELYRDYPSISTSDLTRIGRPK